jgi:hypothetical protein
VALAIRDTKVLACIFLGFVSMVGCEEGKVSLEGHIMPKRDPSRYLGSMLQRNDDIEEDQGKVDKVAASIWNPM